MSFNYNPMAANQLPMMVGSLQSVASTNFMSPAALASTLHHQSQMSSVVGGAAQMLPNMSGGINDAPLEFNIKKSIPISGAGPMDLEQINEDRRMPHSNYTVDGGDRAINADRRLHDDASNSSIDSLAPDKKSINASYGGIIGAGGGGVATTTNASAELMFNGMMGMPQSLMMMPTALMNMIDPMMGLPQFPMMSMQTPTPTTTTSTSTPPSTQSIQQPILSPDGSVGASAGGGGGQMKEVITCKSCTLFPPNPNAPLPTTRERPAGCRTVFVGGLPENVTEDIIREVFELCGEITTLRLSKKNFCHIRFVFEPSVDSAIYLSGYRIRLGSSSSTDPTNCGRLHVDYAQARDDQYEWECKQRQLQREQRHRERVERDRLRPMSPPPIVHYTDHEAATVCDKLKQDDNFAKAVQVLITWLERGDCNKKNANTFYSMIQSSNSHVRRLQTERATYEEELAKAREYYRKQMYSMSVQFTQIEKVFGAASHKKVWDHFTKAQRKNIDMWKKQSSEIRTMHLVDFDDNDEMDMSDDDRDLLPKCSKRVKLDYQSLQVENETLKTELAVYRSDADMVKSMLELDTDVKEKQLKVLQETIRNMQTQLLDNKTKDKEHILRIVELERQLKQANVKELLLKTKIVEAGKCSTRVPIECVDTIIVDDGTVTETSIDEKVTNIVEKEPLPPGIVDAAKVLIPTVDEAKIIGLVSTLLVVHPFGVSLDYVFSYVQRIMPRLRPNELEETLGRFNCIFSEEVTAIGTKLESKWKFCGYNPESASKSSNDNNNH